MGFLVGLTGACIAIPCWAVFTDPPAPSPPREGCWAACALAADATNCGCVLFQPRIAFHHLCNEIMQMLIIPLVATPFDAKSSLLVRTITPRMILANACGAALFHQHDPRPATKCTRSSLGLSAQGATIANRALGTDPGFHPEASRKIAHIVQEETGSPSPSRHLDKIRLHRHREDHHKPGTPSRPPSPLQAIAQNKVLFADGNSRPYRCSISPVASRSVLAGSPARGSSGVIGTIKPP